MDKKIAGLLGAVAGLATIGPAQAAVNPTSDPAEALRAASYEDLLAPVANAATLLEADNAARARAAEATGGVKLAQAYYYGPPPPPPYSYYRYHHHHHHHHHARAYHHHHHHHHASAYFGIPGVGGVVVPR